MSSPLPFMDTDLLDAIAAAVLVIDSTGHIIATNRALHNLPGAAPVVGMGKHLVDCVDEPGQALVKNLFAPLRIAAFPLEQLVAWRNQNGGSAYFFTIGHLWADEYVVFTLRPVDDSLEMYRQMFENTRAVKLLINPRDGSLVDANPAAARFYGYSRTTLRRMNIRQINTASPEVIQQALQQSARGEQNLYEFQHRLADGTVRQVLVSNAPLVLIGQPLLYSIVTDITEMRAVEKTLSESEARFRQVVETMQQGLTMQDAESRMIYVNDVFCDIVGYSRQELLGQPVMVLLTEASQAIVEEQIARRRQGESNRYDVVLHHKSGEPRHALIAATPILSEDGQFQGSFSIVVDVTASKQLEQALIKSNAELDAFAHTVAHDLKSPLSVLIGFADLLINDSGKLSPAEVENYLRMIGDTSDKMIGIIDELLLLSQTRHRQVEAEPLDMPRLIDGAMMRLRYIIQKYNAEIIVPENLLFPAALGYPAWVEAVWANYISNAIKYGGAPPRVEISARVLDDGRPCFSVRDNGSGIPPEKMDRLFIPFERLEKARAEGNGIGLSIVKRIMEKLSGEVHVESTVGAGSTFSFILPPAP